jgi:hypothetical protein
MKFSLISLIALALTSTSVMAAAQPAAVENLKRAFDDVVTGKIRDSVPKGRKKPQENAPSSGFYTSGESITFICYTEKDTSPIFIAPGLHLGPDM